uniref:Uncharacterized protein n=1 Tax=Tanacetum cinerariifolium TaxID=118510 RepID=A0A699TYZ3_TANCI|nr:hypothetical protein [Tanacetum cinerariifolium]
MRKVAKLDEHLITPSEDATNQASGAMYLSGTTEHHVLKTKTQKLTEKKIPSSSKPKASEIVKLSIPQASGSQQAKEIEVTADIT